MFNELDVVGLVVLVGHEQNKGPFQTAVLTDGNMSVTFYFLLVSYLGRFVFKEMIIILASNAG